MRSNSVSKLFLFLSLLALCFFIETSLEAKELSKESLRETKNIKWKIKNPTWTDKNEADFQSFVHGLGMARKKGLCLTLDECLRNEAANPLFARANPDSLALIYSDCADLPFVLRGYFAWMNDLPFAYPTELAARVSFSKKESDIRYSKFGNIVLEKHFVKNNETINRVLENIVDSISTGSFRTNPEVTERGALFRDTYSVDIDRKTIVPGTVLYDPNGHIAVVYEVTKTGQIHMIDSHPDNTLTTITYGEKFPRSSLAIGAGFSRFRPFSVAGGIQAPLNEELPGYSLLQYGKGPFIFKDKIVSFSEYVRLKLSEGDVIYDPISEFSDLLDEICLDIKYREEAVNVAIVAEMNKKEHPTLLPKNIYGADGPWEMYATPSRDARLKAIIRGTKEYLLKVLSGYSSKKLKIKYEGDDLKKDLRDIYQKKSSACTVRPSPKVGPLSMDEVIKNIFNLSFDPYHCPLLRWGIDDKSCSYRNWFEAERGLRNRIDIDYNLKTDYGVDELGDAPASQTERVDLSLERVLDGE